MSEPDQRDIIGYSLKDPQSKQAWIELISKIQDWLRDNDLEEDILFHGTSLSRAEDILKYGFNPTDITLSVTQEMGYDAGSFWGNVLTASAYADDTCENRNPDSRPVLLAVSAEALEEECLLYPDLATLDMPLKGLTKLDDPEISELWLSTFSVDYDSPEDILTWEDGLRDLGAIVAVHDVILPQEMFHKVDSFETFLDFAEPLKARTTKAMTA